MAAPQRLHDDDLSLHHAPIGTLLRERCAADAGVQLDDDQLEHFKTNGYVAGIRVLNADQVTIPVVITPVRLVFLRLIIFFHLLTRHYRRVSCRLICFGSNSIL